MKYRYATWSCCSARDHDQLAQQIGWYRDMYRYQQLEAALMTRRNRREAVNAQFWTAMADAETVKLAYGLPPWRKPPSVAGDDVVDCGSGGVLKRSAADQLFH